ncbi:hypothetical protein AKJ16_DCAP23045 [Drosera capensis]
MQKYFPSHSKLKISSHFSPPSFNDPILSLSPPPQQPPPRSESIGIGIGDVGVGIDGGFIESRFSLDFVDLGAERDVLIGGEEEDWGFESRSGFD